MRHELHYVERGEWLARRKELYEAKYPQTKNGQFGHKVTGNVTRPENQIIPFSADTAAKLDSPLAPSNKTFK